METATRDCKHGRLARSCGQCADEAEIAELRADVAELQRVKAGGTAAEWALRNALSAAQDEIQTLRAQLAALGAG